MIYITGDTHGNWMRRLNRRAFPEQRNMTREDFVIICGDFGIWDDSKEERYNLNWLEGKSFTTLFVDGNHENFDLLNGYPISEWHGGKIRVIRPHIFHLMRGQVFDIGGKRFFTFGGACSHDMKDGILEIGDPRIKRWRNSWQRRFRINHISWWKEEMPTEEEMQKQVYQIYYDVLREALDKGSLYGEVKDVFVRVKKTGLTSFEANEEDMDFLDSLLIEDAQAEQE